jgi:hypothetical protein
MTYAVRTHTVTTYTVFVHDDRYSVPTFYMVTVAGDARALELAEEKLSSSTHYQRVEVFDGERLVGAVQLEP